MNLLVVTEILKISQILNTGSKWICPITFVKSISIYGKRSLKLRVTLVTWPIYWYRSSTNWIALFAFSIKLQNGHKIVIPQYPPQHVDASPQIIFTHFVGERKMLHKILVKLKFITFGQRHFLFVAAATRKHLECITTRNVPKAVELLVVVPVVAVLFIWMTIKDE